jgi:transcriptional regulator with XRE-family HTH domain
MAKSKRISISDQLRRIFLDRQLTPTEVAERSGVDRSIISRFLRDDDDPERRGLTLASVDKLADAYFYCIAKFVADSSKAVTLYDGDGDRTAPARSAPASVCSGEPASIDR